MGNEKFIEECKKVVREYAIEHMDKTDTVPPFDVFVVWSCKTLQNYKALLSTTLREYQYHHALEVDGISGKQTFEALCS